MNSFQLCCTYGRTGRGGQETLPVYERLTKASILHGLSTDMTEKQVVRVLREWSQKELPQNVEYTLYDWIKDYRDVSISQVLLLDVSHEDVIAKVQVLPVLKENGAEVSVLGPTMLAVVGDIDVQPLRKTLEKANIVVCINGEILKRPKS